MEAAVRSDVRNDPVLARVKRDMMDLYGDRFEKLILYGSRARGDHRPDSDYDLIVVIKEPFNGWDEVRRINRAVAHFYEGGQYIDVNIIPYSAEELKKRTVFLWDVRKDGIEI